MTDIRVENNELNVVFAFPFPNIPIADALISSVEIKAKEINLIFNYSICIMNEEEREKFLQLESEAWKGL